MVIVKPRQIMATTAINAALFKFSQDIPGFKSLILSHREKVTIEIFENLKRFQEQMPPGLKQETTKMNDYKMAWRNLSEIVTGVAGTDAGRGFPCLALELSELGRYKERHVRDIQEGAMQAHASAEPGAILVADSTSGGEGNFFHDIAKAGYKNPKSSWFTAFFGWHEMPEYRMTPPKGWVPDSEEVQLMKTLNASVEQIYWRNFKLHGQFRGDLSAFQREYPATFEEAFASAEGRLIDPVVLLNCINSLTMPDPSHPKILGVDPAGGGDRTVLTVRQGYYMHNPLIFNKMDDHTLTNIIVKIMDEQNIDHVCIDMGYGHGTYHNLRALKRFNVTGIYFGATQCVVNKQLYSNMRTEMAAKFQDWCEEGPDGMGGTARLPNHDEFLRDIKMIPKLEFSGNAQKFVLATKEEIKAELGKSPDCFDSAILTFGVDVRPKGINQAIIQTVQQNNSILVSENEFRQYGEPGLQVNPHFNFYKFGPENY